MSGGVDSSVAAFLLQRAGYDVTGVFMKNWSGESLGLSGPAAQKWEKQCPWERDAEDVRRVCQVLDIPYYSMNFVTEYKEAVLEYFFREYAAGRTPNPDVMCNKEIKFKAFFDKARILGADFVATGHYAKVSRAQSGEYQLHIPRDTNKDQTYFLYTLGQEQLAHTLFPLAPYIKPEVRKLAARAGLPTAAKPDSQGICFVGEVDVREFLATRIARTPGPIVTVEGKHVGEHQGLAFYTIGQREGLHVGGFPAPLYVVRKDVKTNTLYVVCGKDHPALYARSLRASAVTWTSEKASQFPFSCEARIRYRQSLEAVVVHEEEAGVVRVDFRDPQRAITPGQSIVFYAGTRVLGGAIIDAPLS